MALLQSTIIQRVSDLLGDNPWMTTATGTGTGAVNVADGTRWDEGAILEWQDTGEQDWVQSVATNALTCIRGINGTTAVTHSGTQNVVRDPFFTYIAKQNAVEQTMLSLWPYIYKAVLTTLTYDATTTWYNLPATTMGIIEVSQKTLSGVNAIIYGAGSSPWTTNLPTATVTSTIGMAFPNGWNNTTNAIQVTYAAKLTASQATTGTYSDISDGLLAEVVAWGAASRLVIASEVPMVTDENLQMGPNTAGPGARGRAGQLMQQMFLDKRRQYQQELLRMNPIRTNTSANPYQVGRLFPGYTTNPPWA